MSRIKIRVSAGVFEVSLLRVIEETSSVEVLWDRGIRREFKWGSVLFGSTDGPVLQKPADLTPPEATLPPQQQQYQSPNPNANANTNNTNANNTNANTNANPNTNQQQQRTFLNFVCCGS